MELAGLSEGELVPQAMAGALGVQEQPGRLLTDTLVETLRNKEILLILDNCEHLIDAVAPLVDVLLDSCVRLRVLATSREAIGVAGEVRRTVPSLSMPNPRHILRVEELEGSESVRLFVERSRQCTPTFTITQYNAQAVAEVCGKLDGIPLAIELAAARADTLSAEQISDMLGDSLRFLIGGGRSAAPRQRTLKGALDWSHTLLSEAEQKLFRRLSVFSGGWILETAEEVYSAEGIVRNDVLDLLSSLVEKSLVVAETGEEGRSRYKMLEPVRQYAWEKLKESGEVVAVQRRHLATFLSLAEETDKESGGPGYARWLHRLETEHGNLRGALDWSLEGGDTELGLRLAGMLWLFWFTRGYSSEGRGWLEKAISLGGSPAARAKALNGAGWISMFQGDFGTAKALLEESLALYRRVKDEDGIASSLSFLGHVALLGHREDIPVAALLDEALALKPRLENRRTIANLLVTAGMAAGLLGGDLGEETALLEEAQAMYREMEDKWGIITCLINLGLISIFQEHHARAKALLQEVVQLSRELDDKASSVYSFFGLACVAASEDRAVRAARLWGMSEAIQEASGIEIVPSTYTATKYESRLAEARVRLGEAVFEAAWAEGKDMPMERGVEYALSEEESAPPAAPSSNGIAADEPTSALTHREREVAILVARGLTNRQISTELGISERTAGNHVARILRKLGLRSRTQIASWATERQLLAPHRD